MKTNNDCINTNCSLYGKCNLGENCYLYKGKKKANKYQAKKCEYEGEIFDSIKERDAWIDLKLLEKAGKIRNLRRQVEYELIPAQREPDRIGKRGGIIKGKTIEQAVIYRADFCWEENGQEIVADVKGYKGGGAYSIFKLKRKLLLWRYGIRIKEI